MNLPRVWFFAIALVLGLLPGGCSELPEPLGTGGDPPVGSGGSERPADVVPCYTELAEGLPATRQFWDALSREDRAARPAATQALRAAAQAHPQEGHLALLLGLSYLWRLGAPTDAEAGDLLGRGLAGLGAKTELERARMLCPSDHRIAAWLGPVLVNLGRSLNDPNMVAQGLAVLDEGIARYPAFVLFSKLLVYADRPPMDPDFQAALQAVRDNIGICGDIRTSKDPACINSARAVHNEEGARVFLADVFTKAGLRDEALRLYEQAKEGRGYGSWPFRRLLEERIATLDARVRALSDADPANDPETAWRARYQCAICHQR